MAYLFDNKRSEKDEHTIDLSIKEQAAYYSGGIGKDMTNMMVYTYFMFFLVAIKGLNPTIIGIAFFVARIWDAINDPLMGALVDNTRTRFGKYRPWIAIGTLINATVTIMMFVNISLPNGLNYLYYIGIYIIWGMSYTLMDVPFWSMIPSLATTNNDRNSLSSMTRIFTSLGGTFGLIGGGIFLSTRSFPRESPDSYLYLAIIVGIAFVGLTIPTVLKVREKVVINSPKIKVKEIFATIFSNDQLLVFLLSITIYITGISLTNSFLIYYFTYDLNVKLSTMAIFSVLNGLIPSFLAFIFPLLAKKIGRKNLFISSLSVAIIGFAGLYLMGTFYRGNLILLGIFMNIAYLGHGIFSVLMTVMLSDIVDYGEYKKGKRTDSIIFSMQPFIYKFSTAFAALVLGITLGAIKIPKLDEDSVNVVPISNTGLITIRLMMFALPILFIIASLIVYVKYYKLNEKTHKEIILALDEIRKSNKSNITEADNE